MIKAPEGATHLVPPMESVRAQQDYWKQVGDDTYLWLPARDEWCWMGRNALPASAIPIKRDEPVAWGGKDLPPAGTVCEMHHQSWADELWEPRKILFISTRHVVTSGPDDDDERISYTGALLFRPIRTPEQIAAEERRGHIATLVQHICADGAFDVDGPEVAAAAAKIYDAGYRKQEAAQ